MEDGLLGLGAASGVGASSGLTPLADSLSPWHHHHHAAAAAAHAAASAYVGGGGGYYHRLLAETDHSSSVYHQPEGGILSGHGVLDDTLSLFMVQVRFLGAFVCVLER
jgi:hypothetical protein